jgi:hypothetical protein
VFSAIYGCTVLIVMGYVSAVEFGSFVWTLILSMIDELTAGVSFLDGTSGPIIYPPQIIPSTEYSIYSKYQNNLLSACFVLCYLTQ